MYQYKPFLPPGGFLEPQFKARARFRVTTFVVLTLQGLFLVALLLQGCNQPPVVELTTGASESPASAPSGPPAHAPAAYASRLRLAPTNPPPKPSIVAAPMEPPAVAAPASAPAPVHAPVAAAGSEYTIRRGDTFRAIARQFHVSVRALMRANPGVRATRLQIGQTVRVPGAPATHSGSTGIAVATR